MNDRREPGLHPLTPTCTSLLYGGKYADFEALNSNRFEALRPVISPAARARWNRARVERKETAVVFGANGFVGAHLIARLSQEARLRQVIAVVRSTQKETSRERLQETFDTYAISPINHQKIQVVTGDPTAERFGLSHSQYEQLANEADMVFNCASSHDYSESYLALRDNWVLSVQRMLQFCVEGTFKHLTYLGSLGAHFVSSHAELNAPESWWYSGYVRMKRVNAEILRWLILDGFHSVTLCEAPYILGSTVVGRDPGLEYSWWRVIEVAKSIGLLWRGPGMVYVPVNVLTDGLASNAMRDQPLAHMHLRNPKHYDNAMLAGLLGVKLASWEEFREKAVRSVAPKRISTLLSANLPHLVDILNAPEVKAVPGWDDSWCDNQRLFGLYLNHLAFRDLVAKDAKELQAASRGARTEHVMEGLAG